MENILEWECILECNFKCNYCTNGHNGVLAEPIRYEKSKLKVFVFLDMIKQRYPDTELFLFGGEPFVHPFIDGIIQKLNFLNQPFVIQTNGSIPQRILKISQSHKFAIQVSVHPNEIKNYDEYINGLLSIEHLARRIDIMFVGEPSLRIYRMLFSRLNDPSIMFLTPVADFNIGRDEINQHLIDFNSLKGSVYSKVYQFEQGDRSTKWAEQMSGAWSPKGKPCMYRNRYILFDPQLKSYSCNYRQNNEICPNQHCFLM